MSFFNKIYFLQKIARVYFYNILKIESKIFLIIYLKYLTF